MSTLTSEYTVKYKDYDGEVSKVTFTVTPLTAVNFDAQEALRAALQTALDNVLLGELQSWEKANVVVDSVSMATDPFAQRELAAKATYLDATALKKYTTQIPSPDLAHLDPTARAIFEIGDAGHVDAWITAFEAYALTPDGNAPEVQEIKLVGRNL